MPVNTKAIKRRIKSVGNTKKITKAMELVSAAKMRRAVDATLRTRTYARMARQVLDLLRQGDSVQFPLLTVRPVEKMLVVLVSSNRGLCGSYNANIFKKTRVLLREALQDIAKQPMVVVDDGETAPTPTSAPTVDIVGVGKKSAEFAKRHGYHLTAVFDELGEKPTFEDILPLSRLLLETYEANTYQKILIAYTDFKSSLVQEAKMVQLLPIHVHDIEQLLGRLGGVSASADPSESSTRLDQYMFEPNLEEILTSILPRLVEIQLYQTILESAASEHSARMLAMRNASDAAAEMIDELTLTLNKARQAAITQEIAEIVGGAAALE